MQDKPGGQALPGGEGAVDRDRVHVDAVLGGDDLGRTDRGGFGRHGGEIAAHAKAAVQ